MDTVSAMETEIKQECHPKRINEPTEDELCEAVILLKKFLPHRSLERSITMLYEITCHNRTPEDLYQTNQAPANEFSKSFQKSDLIKTVFNTVQEEVTYKEKRLAAKAFIAKGYGLKNALEVFEKEGLQTEMTQEGYKKSMAHILTQSFRKLEAFLSVDCHKKIEPIPKQQMKKVVSTLVSNTHYGQLKAHFLKYIRLAYGLSKVVLREGESMEFYLAVQRMLQDREVSAEEFEFNNEEPTEKQAFEEGNQEARTKAERKREVQLDRDTKSQVDMFLSPTNLQQQILEVYEQQQSISKTHETLKRSYPDLQLAKVRSSFCRMLSSAIRHIFTLAGGNELPKLNQEIIHALLKRHEAREVRVELCKLIGCEEKEKQQERVIILIESYLSNHNASRDETEDDSLHSQDIKLEDAQIQRTEPKLVQ